MGTNKAHENRNFTQSFLNKLEGFSEGAGQFFEKNLRLLAILLSAIIILIIAYFVYVKYVLEPKEIQAQNDMQNAISAFEQDDFKRALGGTPSSGSNPGFVDIVEQYSGTKTKQRALLFAAATYYKEAKYKEAIENLEQFSSKDPYMNALVLGMIGDCFMELNQNKQAYDYYQKTIDKKNSYASPIYLLKKGISHLMEKQPSEAYKCFEQIEIDYPDFYKSQQVEKLSARAQASL